MPDRNKSDLGFQAEAVHAPFLGPFFKDSVLGVSPHAFTADPFLQPFRTHKSEVPVRPTSGIKVAPTFKATLDSSYFRISMH